MVSASRTASLALLALLAGAPGCASTQQDFQRAFTPGQLKDGSHVHAYAAASLAYGLTDGHMVQWDARLATVEDDVPPFYEALSKAGYRFDVDIAPHMNDAGGFKYEVEDVHLVLSPANGKGERFVLPGAEGTKMTVYAAALGPAARKLNVPAETLRRGHFALFGLVTMSAQLNASDEMERRHTFGLLVLKEKLTRKEPNADHLAPLRTPEQSLEDVNLAIRVMADHHAAVSRLRAEMLGVITMVRAYELPAARTALTEQLAESRKIASLWEASHKRPTMEDYGVAVQELRLPTPENMLAALDKDGYVTAAIKISKGIAAGDPAATVEGFAKLAPESSSLRIAAEGTAAALRGDVKGAASAILALAEKQEDVAPLAARLRSFEAAAGELRANAASAKNAVAALPTSATDVEKRVKAVGEAEMLRRIDEAKKIAPPNVPR